MATVTTTKQGVAIAPPVSRSELNELKDSAKELKVVDAWVFFAHGWYSSGTEPPKWVLRTERDLNDAGIRMIRPDLPNSIAPSAYQQVAVVLEHMRGLNGPGQLLGHSIGGVLAVFSLSYLPSSFKLDGLTTVSSPSADIWAGMFHTFYQDGFDRDVIDQHAQSVTHIQTIKDHTLTKKWLGWEAVDHARGWAGITGGEIILMPGDNHMGLRDAVQITENNHATATILRNHITAELLRRNK